MIKSLFLISLFSLSFSITQFPLPYNGTYPQNYSYAGTFPSQFIWGLGTAAYQVEGGYNSGGRGATIWDTFSGANTVGMVGSNCTSAPCAINPAMVDKGATGNIADNQYQQFNESIKLMKQMGLKNYRFSIAWSRILPTGRLADGINQEGINYYNFIINSLIQNGIQPFVTLYHWDLPQSLFFPNKGYFGWYSVDNKSNPNFQMTPYFVDFCNICFKNFGDRVKTWITFNEPLTFCWQGSFDMAPNYPAYQDTSKWTYVAAHNVLHAHGSVVKLYRSTYQQSQKGRISMTVNQDWREPKTHLQKDIDAAQRSVEFGLAWFTDPIYFGDYPASMRQRIPNLPVFSSEMSQLVKGSTDFFALNHYTTMWAVNGTCGSWCPETAQLSSTGFLQANSSWLYAVPWGFRKLLNWVKNRYGNVEIIVTENGWSEAADKQVQDYNDTLRVQYYANYTSEMLNAINIDKINITGYFGWSIFDNFEWAQGFSQRFGITFINYNWGYDPNSPTNQYEQPQTIQTHTRKKSSYWWQHMFETNQLISPANYNNDSFLNSTTILYNAISAASTLWGNQWSAFQSLNASIKTYLNTIGLEAFIKESSVQKVNQISANELTNYIKQICKDFQMDDGRAMIIAGNITQYAFHSNHATWLAFHVFYSYSTNLTNYFQFLINQNNDQSYSVLTCETKKQFIFDYNITVLYEQESVAGQAFGDTNNLIFSSKQPQSLFDSILNFFFIVGMKTEGKMLGLNFNIPQENVREENFRVQEYKFLKQS